MERTKIKIKNPALKTQTQTERRNSLPLVKGELERDFYTNLPYRPPHHRTLKIGCHAGVPGPLPPSGRSIWRMGETYFCKNCHLTPRHRQGLTILLILNLFRIFNFFVFYFLFWLRDHSRHRHFLQYFSDISPAAAVLGAV
jgi:hypothetical protein